MATADPSQARGAPAASGQRGAASNSRNCKFSLRSESTLPSKTIAGGPAYFRSLASAAMRPQVLVALGIGEPDHLEGMIPLVDAVGVVVDGFAGAGQQPRGRVLLAEDQVGVGLAALQGDAHRHLADGAAGQRIGPAQRLRAQQHVDAEGPALPHQPVQQQGRLLGDAVVVDEEFLKLIDDQ